MTKFFPKQADNACHFHPVVTWIFAFVTLVTIGRSCVHLFFPDGGATSIASFVVFAKQGALDPNRVIYLMFSLWGLEQLLWGAFYLVVLVFYRSLIPLMWRFILVEYLGRLVIGASFRHLGPLYHTRTVPGDVANYVFIVLALVMIIVSMVTKGKPAKD